MIAWVHKRGSQQYSCSYASGGFHSTYALYPLELFLTFNSLLGATAVFAGNLLGVFLQHGGPHYIHVTVQVIQ